MDELTFASYCDSDFPYQVSQHLLKCLFLLSDPNISLGDNVINKSHGLPFIPHEIQNDETYGYRASTRYVRQPKI